MVGWRISDLADAVQAGLAQALADLDREQAVYGLDSRDELALHPVLEKCFREAGYGVHREQRYPSDRRNRKLTDGKRCDFVLTGDCRELAQEESRGTLFDAPDAVDLDEAFWLEVKVITQFVPDGPNARYASQLLSTVREDIGKLSQEQGILHAALLLILFVRDEIVADHDLKLWQDRCLERSLPIGAPSRRMIPMTDRHGNGRCVIALYPVSHS